jgi:hypothetical protein
MTTYEHMTNSDVITAMKSLGLDNSTSKSSKINTIPVYGPKVSSVEVPEPTPNDKGEVIDTLRIYPDIYGPDVLAAPGTSNIKRSTDDTDYDYNIDLKNAFPTDGPPEPFLSDFSKFQS